ncbi:MAG: hypothetical protein WAU96_09270 [Anaerolineae bacterium]|nr:hypothetical protein [Thermoflexales bacterium]HQW35034.1 hypothetical protein [Thermoflexales bacterium]
MTFEDFKQTLSQPHPPTGASMALRALWHDGRGDWGAAHTCAQNQDDADGAWVHAYLHRVEGDAGNAAYWYRRAGRPVCKDPLKAEWETIAKTLLAQS